ncbi:MAG: RNase A-like domain-containing protein, partial [Alphaproteobacteria bacterium]
MMLETIALAATLHAGLGDAHAVRVQPLVLCQRGRRPPRPRYRGRPRLGPGSLRAHEDHIGHSFRRHIEKSPAWLRARLRRDPDLKTASTFYTVRGAQMAVRDALLRNETRINEWLNNGGYGTIAVSVRYSRPIGMYMWRGMRKPKPGRTATFRLR